MSQKDFLDTFMDAVSRNEEHKWTQAMKEEVKNMEMKAWSLVKRPENCKPLYSRWVYPKKEKMRAI